jgi:site-specific DNA-methyltransferase (adenine-specific)
MMTAATDPSQVPAGWTAYCEDALATGPGAHPDGSVDLIADPPYGWARITATIPTSSIRLLTCLDRAVDRCRLPKLKPNGSLYIFLTWRNSPEIFVMLKQRMTMINEIIWDRRVPSMGGSTWRYSSVHDTIGFSRGPRITSTSTPSAFPTTPRPRRRVRAPSSSGPSGWSGLQPQGCVERVAPASRASRARRPSHAKAPGSGGAHGQGLLPAGGVVLDPFMGSGTTAGSTPLWAPFHGLNSIPIIAN